MKWTITIPEGGDFIRVEMLGDYDLAANARILKEIGECVFRNPEHSLLFDNRKLNVSGVTPNEMIVSNSMFADSDVGASSKKIAILISTDAEYDRAVNWGRIAHAASMTTINVFRDETEAIEWLCGR